MFREEKTTTNREKGTKEKDDQRGKKLREGMGGAKSATSNYI